MYIFNVALCFDAVVKEALQMKTFSLPIIEIIAPFFVKLTPTKLETFCINYTG